MAIFYNFLNDYTQSLVVLARSRQGHVKVKG